MTEKRSILKTIAFYIALILFIIWIAFPFYWQFITSLKGEAEIWNIPPTWIPQKPFWSNYVDIFRYHPFGTYLLNSFVVATATTIFCLLIGSFSAYALAKLKFKGKNIILALVLSVSMFPPIAVAPSLFLILKNLHIIDTYFALIFPYCTFAMPLTLWNLTAFFRQIPTELNEAAKVDGCNFWQAFWKVLFPLAAPGLFTTAILVFIFAWNEFLFALIFMTSTHMRTVPVGIALFPGQYTSPWGQISAASVVVTVPLIIMVLAFQRRIVAGLTAGAVKG